MTPPAGPDSRLSLPRKCSAAVEPAVALHEIAAAPRRPRRVEPAAHARDVAVEHGRQVRVGERRIAAHDELRQRQHAMRDGHLPKADRARDSARDELVLRKSIPVQQHDRDAVEAGSARGLEIARAASPCRAARALGPCASMRSAAPTTRAYSISGSGMSSAKMSGRCWPPIRMASSNPAVMTSTRRLAAPLEQRVRRDGRAHLDGRDVPLACGRGGEQPLDAGDGGVLVTPRIDGQSFSVLSSPDGARATTSVNVPPRSIQNSQPRFMRPSRARHRFAS